jgi:A/G-specific adenine glycosylase
MIQKLGKSLAPWYAENQRALPWRESRDAYRIWLSEVMLQQTTVVAVIPYYERFLKRFPTLKSLGTAPVEDVLEMWAGLGYYSRARNLHKSAQALLARKDFPRTAAELLELPGFGPYTSRAVASLAFGEAVGVLDGNVIRVLCRVFGLKLEWWKSKEREELQQIADQLAQSADPYLVNQGLMELGATICTPQSPTCLLCPWSKFCVARAEDLTAELPLKKPRKAFEFWLWTPEVYLHRNKVALVRNDYAPFLKGQMLFPGSAKKVSQKPKKYDLKHGITHHDIYIQLASPIRLSSAKKSLPASQKDPQWISIDDLRKINPSKVLQKILDKSLPSL